jgi:hypothetical protein
MQPAHVKAAGTLGPLPLLRIEEPPGTCGTGRVSSPSPCPPLRLSISSLAPSSLALPSVRCEHLHLLHISCSLTTPICRSIYGITCLQTYTYYVQNSAKDSILLKAFVRACLASVLLRFSPLTILGCVLVVSLLDEVPLPSPTTKPLYRMIDSFHVALVAHVIYYYSVTNWGDIFVVIKTVWSVPRQSARDVPCSHVVPQKDSRGADLGRGECVAVCLCTRPDIDPATASSGSSCPGVRYISRPSKIRVTFWINLSCRFFAWRIFICTCSRVSLTGVPR